MTDAQTFRPEDFGTPEMLEDPFAMFRELRATCPVAPIPQRNVHLVTRREDIEYVALHPELFSSKGRGSLQTHPGQRYRTMPDLTSTDPPEHKEIRTAHLRLLSSKRIRDMRPGMEAEAHRLVDQFAGDDSVELISAFAKPLPAWVMGTLLDAPKEMYAQLDRWAVEYFDLFDKNLHRADGREPPQHLIDSFVTFMNWCGDFVVERRENPRGDDISEFINTTKKDGSLFSIDEMANYIRLLVVGAQTSTYMIAQAVIEVVRMGERADFGDERYLQRILDETLRKDGPATYGPRVCLEDVELGGQVLPAGTRVLLAWQSGSRDEEVFECPEAFEPGRKDLSRHLGFGLGIHRCIGAPLAHAEGIIALKVLFSRFRTIRLAARNDFSHDTSLTGMRVLNAVHLEIERA